MTLVKRVYEETQSLPKEEMFGLTAQTRRAAVSIPCNIAEGQGRASKKEFGQFLAVSRGSTLELQTQLQIAADLGFLGEERVNSLIALTEEVLRLLNGLMKSLR